MAPTVIMRSAFDGRWLRFAAPIDVVEVHEIGAVLPALEEIEERVEREMLYAAGFISYEASPAFDPALQVRQDSGRFPLLWFAIFRDAEVIDEPEPVLPLPAPLAWRPSVSRAEYEEKIGQVKAHLGAGNTYQVNLTHRLDAPCDVSSYDLFAQLARAQNASFAAFIDTADYAICSASPELFFTLRDGLLVTRPMKGTRPRGRWFEDDAAQAKALRSSPKEQAENVMIVDMLRNDMGRVAVPGTVVVERLFEAERYPTVWQMTSTITSRTSCSTAEVLKALFPCASVTGAPKARTMQIISELENRPRRVYTGAMGFMTPAGTAQFNVAIRTVLIDKKLGTAEYGVGGGVVWDSTAQGEFEECQTKAQVLFRPPAAFELLETLLWRPEDGYFLLENHLRRLKRSATYFQYPFDADRLKVELDGLVEREWKVSRKVRVLLSREGTVRTESSELAASGTLLPPATLRLALEPVDSNDPFLYHKTTRRDVYQRAREAQPDCDDVLLWNGRREITETTIANVIVTIDGERLTPPLACGLLPGTYREWLLAKGKIREQVIPLEAIESCDAISVVNSVRGERPAELLWPDVSLP